MKIRLSSILPTIWGHLPFQKEIKDLLHLPHILELRLSSNYLKIEVVFHFLKIEVVFHFDKQIRSSYFSQKVEVQFGSSCTHIKFGGSYYLNHYYSGWAGSGGQLEEMNIRLTQPSSLAWQEARTELGNRLYLLNLYKSFKLEVHVNLKLAEDEIISFIVRKDRNLSLSRQNVHILINNVHRVPFN
jgi:hypothetical protein